MTDISTAFPNVVDLAALAENDPEPPRFVMPGVPEGAVTSVFGHGGAGKSAIELRRAVCIAMGIPFAGLEVNRRRVLFVSCEDKARILHWRLHHLCRSLGIAVRDLVGHFFMLDLVGHDAVLYSPMFAGTAIRVQFGALQERIKDVGASLVVIDGTTHTFGGNENDRGHVTGYANMLAGIMEGDSGSVIVIGHVAKDVAKSNGKTTEAYSGSTAWNNAFRARWYLSPEGDGENGRTGRVILEAQKGNYGGDGLRVVFEWDHDAHVFAPVLEGTDGTLRVTMRDVAERDGIMEALRDVYARGDYVPAATTGPRMAINVLAAAQGWPPGLDVDSSIGKSRAWKHIEALRAARAIVEVEHRGNDRHRVKILRPATAGNAGDAGNAGGDDGAIAGNAESPA